MKVNQNGELSKKDKLLSDPDIKRWHDNLARGSIITAEVALRRLSLFCEKKQLTPKSLLKLNKKQIQNIILDTITKLEEEEYAPDYISGIVKAVKSWLRHNHIKAEESYKIMDSGTPVTLAKERVPKPSELDQILAAGDLRAKTSTALISYGGLRPQSLGNFSGEDGLILSDFPGLLIDSEPRFTQIPARVMVRRKLSKTRQKYGYFTYLNEKGCTYLIGYLKERIAKGEQLTSQSPLIKATERKEGAKFVTTANIGMNYVE